jgi:hypothetical protein
VEGSPNCNSKSLVTMSACFVGGQRSLKLDARILLPVQFQGIGSQIDLHLSNVQDTMQDGLPSYERLP